MSFFGANNGASNALAGVVFVRTSKALVTAEDFANTLPPTLYTLLQAIDGQSPVSRYESLMASLAPVAEKFEQLELLGYTSRQPAVSARLAPGAPAVATAISENDLLALAGHTMGQGTAFGTKPGDGPAAPRMAGELAALQLEKWASAADNPAPPSGLSNGPGTAQLLPAKPATGLEAIRAEMQAFLNRSAGMDGLPMAMMLEQITSLAQLGQELPDYLLLVSQFGDTSGDHARQVQAMLAAAFEAERY